MLGAMRCQSKFKSPKGITMISLDWARPKDPPLSLGHASILANLYANKINVRTNSWAVNHPSFKVEDVVQYIERFSSLENDLAMGVFVWNEEHVKKIINKAKHIASARGQISINFPQLHSGQISINS